MIRISLKSLCMMGALTSMSVLGACAPWPPYGVGGLAENHAPIWIGDRVHTSTARLISVKERMELLGRLGGEAHFPAAMEELRLSYTKAARAHGGRMSLDTKAFLTELEAELEVLARRLDKQRRRNLPMETEEYSL